MQKKRGRKAAEKSKQQIDYPPLKYVPLDKLALGLSMEQEIANEISNPSPKDQIIMKPRKKNKLVTQKTKPALED